MTDAVAVSAIAAVGAIIVAMLQRNHNAVNGRMTELLELTRKNSHAEGVKDEKEDRADRKERDRL